ncbi:uncharacterized protein LOC108336577 [Vigna angularis]|uniref:uncharacterized protein LOC108336577 n=1 Tax=Phaseolus angularis TaxID=3914 RepID=UPI000809E6C9|nr:uncharacterized protein LOC108336577 [Vigna angularis]
MEQDPTTFMQEMRRRMEAMQAEIETLRGEHDAARGAQANRQSSARAATPPIVEMSETEPDSEEDTDPVGDSHHQDEGQARHQGEDHSEADSRRTTNRPVPAGRARTLHPFTTAVMEEQIPERAFPVLEKYDGSGDPEEHLRSFVNAMTIYSPNENVWCKVFSLSIKGETLAWFHSLRPRTINDFATLRDMFERQFSTSKARNLTYMELTNIKQEKGESLRNFMDRFNKTARQVRGVGKKFTISTLATTLRPSPFADNLFGEPPLTLDELQERAVRFIRIEEMQAVQRRQQEKSSTSEQEKKEGKKLFVPGERPKGQKYIDGPKGARFEKYTPLNMPRARVLEEALSADLIRLRPSRSSPKADGTKHCTYHLNIGHTTEDCTVLRDKVKELIRAGHLRKFVKEDQRTRSPPRRTRMERSDRRDDRRPDCRRSRSRSHDRSLRDTINTISGGFVGESSASARKRNLRELNLRELKSVH